jgi:clan AA aspartic protease
VIGSFSNGYPLLPITLHLVNDPSLVIEFVVDTGFSEYLTLPALAVAALRLPLLYELPADLADGTVVDVPVHVVTIVWEGVEKELPILATGKRPLLGRAMLRNQELTVQFTEGGLVAARELQPPQ